MENKKEPVGLPPALLEKFRLTNCLSPDVIYTTKSSRGARMSDDTTLHNGLKICDQHLAERCSTFPSAMSIPKIGRGFAGFQDQYPKNPVIL